MIKDTIKAFKVVEDTERTRKILNKSIMSIKFVCVKATGLYSKTGPWRDAILSETLVYISKTLSTLKFVGRNRRKVTKRRVELAEQLCRVFGYPKFVSILLFLAILRGPNVGLPCNRRRRRLLVDGHDTLLPPPFSLFLISTCFYATCLALATFFGWISWVNRW